MRWLQLSIQAPPEYAEPLIHLFNMHGEGSASVEGGGGYNPDEGEKPDPAAWVTIKGWLPIDATTQSRKTAIDVGVRLVRHLVELPEIEEKLTALSLYQLDPLYYIQCCRLLFLACSEPRALLIP